jgi:alpha-1,3-rhamnosyltransferase
LYFSGAIGNGVSSQLEQDELVRQAQWKGADTSETLGKVSVFVPSYNHARFIERCLRSIMNQTHKPSNLLVIDDGSTDNSVKVIEHVLKDCPFPCELIARANKGLCATLNEGLSRTSGEYFSYIGSDDLWLPNFLAERMRVLKERPNAVLAYGHAYLIDEHDHITDCSLDWVTSSEYLDGDVRPLLFRGIAPISSTIVHRRSALEKRRWNQNAKLEDYELNLLLAHDGEFAFDPQVLSTWRVHSYNTSRDVVWLLQECLEAQERVVRQLGLGREQLKLMQRGTRFHYVEDFIRKGYKAKALKLFVMNLSGAGSLRNVARNALRLVVPGPVLQLRRHYLQKASTARYGTVSVERDESRMLNSESSTAVS